MKLFNTLSRKKEEFKPQNEGEVSLYTCGPTVYDSAHIGNLRTYIFEDLLKRTLEVDGSKIKHVMNVTDVDDKTINSSGGLKVEFEKCVKKYELKFFNDCEKLNISSPDVIARATEYVDKIVKFVEELIEKGYAYKADDGSTYFSIDKFKNYGRLSNLDKEGMKVGARVSQDEYDKENPADFALWKAWDERDGEIYWETSLGKGRPGWHIECSAMATDTLGPTIDIHAGAVDLIFPHHENEIAQAEAKNGKEFVRYWVHGEHLLVDGKKMSKSLQNFYTLDDIVSRGYDPLDFRYLVVGSHYRSKLNFTWAGLESAKNARERLLRLVEDAEEGGKVSEKYLSAFRERIFDDLDTPGSLAVLWEMIRDNSLSSAEKAATFSRMNEIVALGSGEDEQAPENVVKLANERVEARGAKDFSLSDKLRDQIADSGWAVEDLPDNKFKLVKRRD